MRGSVAGIGILGRLWTVYNPDQGRWSLQGVFLASFALVFLGFGVLLIVLGAQGNFGMIIPGSIMCLTSGVVLWGWWVLGAPSEIPPELLE